MQKKNFLTAELQKRYDAFWNCDVYDRFLTFMSAGGAYLTRPEGMSDEEFAVYKWDRLDVRAELNRQRFERTKFYLDGFPTEYINFGPGSLAASIGGNYQFAVNTVWFDRNPVIQDWNTRPTIAFDPNTPLWQKTIDLMDRILDNGVSFASLPAIGSSVDLLASLRGTENLLYDLYDHPEEIKRALSEIRSAFRTAYMLLTDRMMARQEGMATWMPIWCRDRYETLQCDFSAMISTDMFKEFVLPDLMEQSEFVGKTIYHLDGVAAIPHLDHLLSIPKVNAIQWSPGTGTGYVTDECWFEMYDKIQAAGKGLVLFVEKPECLEKLIRHISPKGVFLSVYPNDDDMRAEIIDMIEKMGTKK